MRLLHAKTHELHEFLNEGNTPEFAILSHTWGEEEVTLQQLHQAGARERAGYLKIQLSCEQALRDGLDWVWIDTCCIDKTSTAELSEAINSMFRWYKIAKVCYAYLSDVKSLDDLPHSRWFTRGWTLQELVAPANIQFYGYDWLYLGSKLELRAQLSSSSGIEDQVLRSGLLHNVNVARKMSWAARRNTTRMEDEAYCLLGIFDVNMPLLYGEGRRAFARLQEEIMKISDDQSLFAWGLTETPKTVQQYLMYVDGDTSPESSDLRGLFADSPSEFTCCDAITVLETPIPGIPPMIYSKGVRIELRALEFSGKLKFAALSCTTMGAYDVCLGFPLRPWGEQWSARAKELILFPTRVLFSNRSSYLTASTSVCLIKEPSLTPPKSTKMTALYIRPEVNFEDNYVLENIARTKDTQLSVDQVLSWPAENSDQVHAALFFTPKRAEERNLEFDSRNNERVLELRHWKLTHNYDFSLIPPKIQPKTQPKFGLLIGGTFISPWAECFTLLSDHDADAEFPSRLKDETTVSMAKLSTTSICITEALDCNALDPLGGVRRRSFSQTIAPCLSTQKFLLKQPEPIGRHRMSSSWEENVEIRPLNLDVSIRHDANNLLKQSMSLSLKLSYGESFPIQRQAR